VGDVGDGSERERRVARGIAAAHAAQPLDLLLLLGDLIYPDGEVDQYREKFADPYEPVLQARIPLLATLGNHDIRTDASAFQKAFGMPGPYFNVVRGPVEFFVLDTSRGRVDGAQVAWLEAVLKASRSPWKVAVMHVPLYSSSTYHGSSPRLQASLQWLFERHGVQLVLAGHDHNYERTVPIGDVTYVVSGGGCCPRDEEVARSSVTAAVSGGLSFAVLDVGPETMSVTALDPAGAILDQATIPRVSAVQPAA
jgi:3',5'-cyclic AMP phosphodiesterase CpdA